LSDIPKNSVSTSTGHTDQGQGSYLDRLEVF